MQVITGHIDQKGKISLPRAGVEPSEIIFKQIFYWIKQKLEAILASGKQCQIALAFINMMTQTHDVVQPDVVVLILQDSCDHIIFRFSLF